MLLARLLRGTIAEGELRIIDASGRTHRVAGDLPGPLVTLRFHSRDLPYKLVLNPRLYAGEGYMDGSLTIEDGTVFDLLGLIGRNIGLGYLNGVDRAVSRLRMLWRRFQQANPIGRAEAHVAHHYDLSGELYELFLDADRQYSCAYFAHPDLTLDAAQEAKKRHLAAKLALRPGQRVLDIGCGWGGLALYLARVADVEVTGITLSTEQLRAAQRRAAEAGLGDRVHFFRRDYREESGRYDRIVSVGMFEHVGVPHYREFFGKVEELLAEGGVALLHTIAHAGQPSSTNPWLRKYIFPGGYCPSLSEVFPVVERAGLWVTDLEILRLHYAETLRHWRQRFLANRDKAAALYDERFCRMWEFYLAGSETSFRHHGQVVAQIQMAKSIEALPLTRDYMTDWERAQALEEPSRSRRLKSV